MCWEFNAPISLNDIVLGVCRLDEDKKTVKKEVSFTASTSRTVTFMLKDKMIQTWVNQSVPNKNNKIDLGEDKFEWYPFVQIKADGVTVVFNPSANEPNSQITKYNPYNLIDP